MANFTIREYPSAEASETAYLATDAKLLPLQGRAFSTRVNRVEFERLWLSSVQESAARLKRLETRPDRFHLSFLLRSDQAVVIDGAIVPENGLTCHVGSGRSWERTLGPTEWCAVSLPAEAMASAGVALADREISLPVESTVVPVAPPALQRLKELCREAAALNQLQPHRLKIPEVARGLEQTAIAALVRCLADPDAASRVRQYHPAAFIVERFHRMIEMHPERALYMPEVSAAIRVPERTLRLSCHKVLGMGPARYLLLRRLHLAHRALARATPGETTVTDVATRFGFWHFGRFAAGYRSLFNEAPSKTLRQATERAAL